MTSQTAAAPAVSADVTSDDHPLHPFSFDISSVLALLHDEDALDEWFLEFADANMSSGYRFEIDQHGRLWAMASEGILGWRGSMNLCYDLMTWCDAGPGGLVFPGNALIRTQGRGRRAADAGWIAPEQIDASLPPDWQEHGIPFAPRFLVEVRSRSNSLESQQAKMEEWMAYGVAVGWLIDPFLRQVHVYRPGAAPEILDDPEIISGDPELSGFVFQVRRRIFDLQPEAEQ